MSQFRYSRLDAAADSCLGAAHDGLRMAVAGEGATAPAGDSLQRHGEPLTDERVWLAGSIEVLGR